MGDMVEIHVLASGSNGNCTLIRTNNRYILIDVGISYSRIKSELFIRGIDIKKIDTVLITHEHSDHVCGLKVFLNNAKIENIFLTKGTHKEILSLIGNIKEIGYVKADEPFFIDDLCIHPLMISHDAKEPIGYMLTEENKKVVYMTDTGYIPKSYIELLKDADMYILESNHSPLMLMNSNRSFHLKRRILGEKGHMSNDDACYMMNSFVENKKTIWVVAHISEECNTILEIEKEMVKSLKKPELIEVYFATQEGLGGIKI